MTMVEIIELKKNNHVLTKEQIHFVIDGYCNNKIPDYQMSAFLMTICFNGLSKQEIFLLTDESIGVQGVQTRLKRNVRFESK